MQGDRTQRLPDTPVEIRPIGPGDSVAELTDLLHRAYASLAAMGFCYVATHQSEQVTRERIAAGECYVAVTNDGAKLIGTVTLRRSSPDDGTPWYRRPGVCVFGQFAVDPAWQGRGVGSRLLETVERRAVALGATEIALDTAEGATHLIDLYARRGYRFIEHVRWTSVNYRSVVMSKQLAAANPESGL